LRGPISNGTEGEGEVREGHRCTKMFKNIKNVKNVSKNVKTFYIYGEVHEGTEEV